MNKKQKKTLERILIAVALVILLKLLPALPMPVELALYCIPYLVVGWDVLRKALKGYTEDATVLIVAQRVSTIMHAEQIVVLDEGKVVGIGTHEQLLESCEEYQEIYWSQNERVLAKEEA